MIVKIHQGSLRVCQWDWKVWLSGRGILPEESFEWAGVEEDGIDVVEKGEVGVDFHDPVRLGQDNCADVEQGPPPG